MSDRDIIAIVPDKHGGNPCIRGAQITLYDVFGWIAVGMSAAEIIEDFPELKTADIVDYLEFVVNGDHHSFTSMSASELLLQY